MIDNELKIQRLEKILSQLPCTTHCYKIRYRMAINGTKMFKLQCTKCGDLSRDWIPHSEVKQQEIIEQIDDGLRARYQETVYELESEIRQLKKARMSAERSAEYHEYLATDQWKKKAAAALLRDGNRCQGCLCRKATQVHHITYDNVGDELLFQLVSLCDECHKKVHGIEK